jgi:hypothetical protein
MCLSKRLPPPQSEEADFDPLCKLGPWQGKSPHRPGPPSVARRTCAGRTVASFVQKVRPKIGRRTYLIWGLRQSIIAISLVAAAVVR